MGEREYFHPAPAWWNESGFDRRPRSVSIKHLEESAYLGARKAQALEFPTVLFELLSHYPFEWLKQPAKGTVFPV